MYNLHLRSQLCSPHLKGRTATYIIQNSSARFSLPSHLHIYSIIYLYHMDILLYLHYNPIKLCIVKIFQLWQLEFYFQNFPSFFGTPRYSRHSLYISYLSSRICYFSKQPWFSLLKNGMRNRYGSQLCICLLGHISYDVYVAFQNCQSVFSSHNHFQTSCLSSKEYCAPIISLRKIRA